MSFTHCHLKNCPWAVFLILSYPWNRKMLQPELLSLPAWWKAKQLNKSDCPQPQLLISPAYLDRSGLPKAIGKSMHILWKPNLFESVEVGKKSSRGRFPPGWASRTSITGQVVSAESGGSRATEQTWGWVWGAPIAQGPWEKPFNGSWKGLTFSSTPKCTKGRPMSTLDSQQY